MNTWHSHMHASAVMMMNLHAYFVHGAIVTSQVLLTFLHWKLHMLQLLESVIYWSMELTSMLKDKDGKMLTLLLATAENKTDVAHLLLDHNDDVSIQDKYGWIVRCKLKGKVWC